MSVKKVMMTEDVYTSCAIHAMTTDKEEIMGLLLGDVINNVAFIWAYCIQIRNDKRKDRVEVPYEALVEAMGKAEELTKTLGRTTRVIGWYHSHPHITCPPSHVDLRTQHNFQQMDAGFVGLIYSVFDCPKDPAVSGYSHRMELRGFQADPPAGGVGACTEKTLKVTIRYTIPNISPEQREVCRKWCKNELVGMVQKLFEEEKAMYEKMKEQFTDPITRAQCASIYKRACLRLVQDCVHPLLAIWDYDKSVEILNKKYPPTAGALASDMDVDSTERSNAKRKAESKGDGSPLHKKQKVNNNSKVKNKSPPGRRRTVSLGDQSEDDSRPPQSRDDEEDDDDRDEDMKDQAAGSLEDTTQPGPIVSLLSDSSDDGNGKNENKSDESDDEETVPVESLEKRDDDGASSESSSANPQIIPSNSAKKKRKPVQGLEDSEDENESPEADSLETGVSGNSGSQEL